MICQKTMPMRPVVAAVVAVVAVTDAAADADAADAADADADARDRAMAEEAKREAASLANRRQSVVRAMMSHEELCDQLDTVDVPAARERGEARGIGAA